MTQQISDSVLIEGDPFSLRYGLPFPKQHPMILNVENTIPRRTPPRKNSACRLGYTAAWAMTSGRLHLVRLKGKYSMTSEEPLFADWASTVTQLSLGNINPALGNSYEPVFEAYLEIEIVEGIATRWRMIEGRELSARKIKGPAWQVGFNWSELKDFVHASGVKFDFEMTDADRPRLFWGPLKELAFDQGFLTLADIARFMPIEQWNSGEFPGAYYLLKWIRTFDIKIRPD
jgi:hypothetical protein